MQKKTLVCLQTKETSAVASTRLCSSGLAVEAPHPKFSDRKDDCSVLHCARTDQTQQDDEVKTDVGWRR
eukprot:2374429-Amphidinium_carterae.1